MAQYGRPIADSPPVMDIWPGQPWWSKLDESVASDADYIESAVGSVMRVQLGLLLPPGVDTGHIIRVRTGKASGSTNGNLYLEDAGQNVIAQYPVDTLSFPTGFTTTTWNLTSLEASGILDSEYLELYVRIAAYGAGARVSWVEMEIPDAAPIRPTLSEEIEFSQSIDGALTLRPTLAEVVEFSQLVPGTIDPQRLIDAGRQFTVTRGRVALKDRSYFVDFEG